MGLTQGFHSFTSYQSNRKVKWSFLMWFLRLLSLHQHLDTRIRLNGKNLDCVIRRGNLFQRVASSVVQNYFSTIPETWLH